MPWPHGPADRRKDAAVYGAAWRRVRITVLRRDQWRCQVRLAGCQGAASQVDHINPVANGGTWHDPQNLRAICEGCHRTITGLQGGTASRSSTQQPVDPTPRPATNW